MPEMKICTFDVETTGVDENKNGVTQISFELGRVTGVRYYRLVSHDYRIRPFPTDEIDPEALKVQGRTLEEVMAGEEPSVVYKKMLKTFMLWVDKYDRTDKMFFIAYNGEFDMGFLRKFWEKNGDNYLQSFFFWPDIDMCRVAGFHMMDHRQSLKNFKLGTVVEQLGIKLPEDGKLHDALTDVILTRDMFLLLKGMKKA